MTSDFPILRVDTRPGDLALLFHDVHAPIHDPGAWAVMMDFARAFRPRFAIGAGDIFDTNALSKHRKNALQVITSGALTQEADAIADDMQEIRSLVQYAVAMEGNHEGRVTAFVDDNPGLLGSLEWHTPFASALQGWDCLPSDSAVALGRLLIHHGHDLTGTLSTNPAHAVLARYPGQNTYFGHCHRIESCTRPTMKHGHQVVHGAWTCGHLSDPRKQHYAKGFRASWQQGFAVVEFWGDREFTVHPVRIFRDADGNPFAHVLGTTLRP